jgi:hypothetical protein
MLNDIIGPHQSGPCTFLLISTMYSSNQLLELFVVLCTADYYRYDFSKTKSASAYARSKSGPVRPDSMPTPLSVNITTLQRLAYLLVPTIYILAVGSLGFQQPPWMNALALPEMVCGVGREGLSKSAVRVLACVASIALQTLSDDAFQHLGDQFHPIGVRTWCLLTVPDIDRSTCSVARHRGSSRQARTPGFVILFTRTSAILLLSFDNVPTDTT